MTNTSQSGSQQLLLNSSVDAALDAIDFSPLAGLLVYLDTSGLGSENSGYLPYRIRKQLISSGVRLTESKEDAKIVLEAGLSAYGTDSQTDEIGITEADSIPDIYLLVRNTQYGVVKLSMFAWEKESGEIIWDTCQMRADSMQQNRKFLGFGPYYSGTIEHPANRFGR